ncbi:MAG: LysR family transcriptional regulator [Rhizobiales bacterium]|nr:LysR family transcriptional regulator [Hyphomicrobiales bacterium]
MDIQLIRTYLEIISSGSFMEAAGRVHVTQAAVSLRVKRLEQELGQSLFKRSKKGTELTPAGEQFERFARLLVKVWEEAKYQIAVPSGYADLLSIGCQHSLWPKFGGRWLRELEKLEPEMAFRAEVGMPERLMRMMIQGTTDVSIMYMPQMRPGLRVEELVKEELILVSPDPEYPASLDDRYVFMDWGPEFAAAHAMHFPDFNMARTNLAIGPLALNFVFDQNRAAYFPTRLVKPHVDDGRFHIVAEAPVFPYPAFVVWNTEKNPELMDRALVALHQIAAVVDGEQEATLDDAEIDLESVSATLQD